MASAKKIVLTVAVAAVAGAGYFAAGVWFNWFADLGDAGVVATTRMLETLVAQREATQRAAALQRGVSEPKQIVFGTFTCTRLIRRMLSCGICPF